MENDNIDLLIKNKKTLEENIFFGYDVSLSDCEIISEWIKDENKKNGNHMIEKNKLELYEQVKEYWWCTLKIWDKLVWFICIMWVDKNWLTLFEPWSLFIKKEHRNKWLWQKMKDIILKKYPNIPMYSVTNVDAVKKINKNLLQHEYKKQNLKKELLEIIEIPWKLLDDDFVYWNELFNILNQKND